MRSFLTFLCTLLCVTAFGANPSYTAFIGTNGITITSNPPQGRVIIDGRDLTNGLAFTPHVFTNDNGTLRPIDFPTNIMHRVVVPDDGTGTNFYFDSRVHRTNAASKLFAIYNGGSNAVTIGPNGGIFQGRGNEDPLPGVVLYGIFDTALGETNQQEVFIMSQNSTVGYSGAADLLVDTNYGALILFANKEGGTKFTRFGIQAGAGDNPQNFNTFTMQALVDGADYMHMDPNFTLLTPTNYLFSSSIRITNIHTLMSLQNSNTPVLEVDGVGDLRMIKRIPYLWPSAQGAVSTALTNDGSGGLGWWPISVVGGGGGGDSLWTNEPSGRIHPIEFTNRVELQRSFTIGTNAQGFFGGPPGTNDFIFGVRDITKDEDYNPRIEFAVASNAVYSLIASTLSRDKASWRFTHLDEGGNTAFAEIGADKPGGTIIVTSTNGITSFAVVETNIFLNGIAYRFPASYGSDGFVLTNDGAGNLGWNTDQTGVGGGGLTTNANQFLGVPLSFKDSALLTNTVNHGAGFLGAVTNIVTAPQFLGTNVVFDGSISSWFQFNPHTGPETNYVFTNIQAGQTIHLSTFVTNGTTVRLWANTTEIPGSWYLGNNGFAANINSNAPSVVTVTRNPLVAATNVSVVTRDLDVIPGSNVSFTTNFVTGEVTISSIGATLSGTTNVFNLSVQAAKLPFTNYPSIDGGWDSWESVYFETNAEGSRANLTANYQLMVPADYATNSLSLLINYSLLATNGPNTSNVIFGASILVARSGTTNNVHTNLFGFTAWGTNDWIAKYDGTNIVTNLLINLGTNAGIKARDLATIKIQRDAVNDTYGGHVAVHGLQLEYTRP